MRYDEITADNAEPLRSLHSRGLRTTRSRNLVKMVIRLSLPLPTRTQHLGLREGAGLTFTITYAGLGVGLGAGGTNVSTNFRIFSCDAAPTFD